ncbi:hypothetical protein FSP39_021912 [Pinctada imbricata]|uniref:Uncharacterized protein n=1 Tax=Pinctada imbricata TaxID=66713 RepID=A0AA88Y190_PINIB|nr:hypothetical protein FSP39_021912 [Pinctada imbricata]
MHSYDIRSTRPKCTDSKKIDSCDIRSTRPKCTDSKKIHSCDIRSARPKCTYSKKIHSYDISSARPKCTDIKKVPDPKYRHGASPAKMLRVATPSNIHHNHEPRIRSPLRPKQEINSLRRHIVGMVREQTADHSVDNIKSCESTIIYQIKKKGGIAPLNLRQQRKLQRTMP